MIKCQILNRIFIIGVIATGLSKPTLSSRSSDHDDYSDDEEYADSLERPKFLATQQSFSVEVGDRITFPCEIDKEVAPFFLIFKYISSSGKDRMIYVGGTPVGRNRRIVKEGNSFILSGVKKNDAGQYVCRFETDPVVELNHTLNVQYPAKVHRASDEVQRVIQGATVSVQCKADGNPTPAITWSKSEGRLPSGAQSEEGLELTFEDVDRHVEGTYICTAANGIGEPSNTSLTIQVESSPEIITQQTILKKEDGYEAQLLCIVHGRPNPDVLWHRNEHLVASDRHIMTYDGGHRHALTINPLNDDDFDNYTCKARNLHGEEERIIGLTGLPTKPEITSGGSGGEETSYTLTWKSETFSPILQYRIKHRKTKSGREHMHRHHKWAASVYPKIRPSTRDAPFQQGTIKMQHTLSALSSAQDYEAVIVLENRFGWSQESNIFKFSTRKEIPLSQSANQANSAKTSTFFLSSCLMLLCILLTL